MKALKKWWKFIVLGVVILLIVVFVAITMMLGTMVKYGVLNTLPRITGTPVELESLSFSLLQGRVTIKDFVIKNPQEFKSEHAFKLDELKIDLSPMSLMSNKIVIEEILIDGAHVTYEAGLGTSNLTQIQSNIKKYSDEMKEEEEEEEEEEEKPKKRKKFQIDVFDFKNGKLTVSGGKILEGKRVSIPLPTVHIEGIGKDSEEGASSAEVAKEIYKDLYKSIIKLAGSTGTVIKEGASGVVDKIKNIFK